MAWNERLFGNDDGGDLEGAVDRLLMGRGLSTFPLAGDARAQEAQDPGPFVERWQRTGIVVAFPPELAQLQGGIAAVNRLLRKARVRDVVGLPSVARRFCTVHAGALHPGEALPASVPDARSLRLRVLRHCPAVALTTALLLWHRAAPSEVEIRRIDNEWTVCRSAETMPLFRALESFGEARGWVLSRRGQTGLSSLDLLRAMEAVGIATVVGKTAVLDEVLFRRMASEAEEAEAHAWLSPLSEAFAEGSSA